MDITQLDDLIKSNEMDKVGSLIDEIVQAKDFSMTPYLITLLKETNNHNLRDRIAMALSDLGIEEIVEVI
ncbi:MAG: hypothetical protein K6T94_09785 [Paenibacillus sp.]|nr:hypothetical protein [Paenibacillus sp.]